MRKYIHIARCMKPKLTEEASAVIAEQYSKLRSEDVVESDVARVCITWILYISVGIIRNQYSEYSYRVDDKRKIICP